VAISWWDMTRFIPPLSSSPPRSFIVPIWWEMKLRGATVAGAAIAPEPAIDALVAPAIASPRTPRRTTCRGWCFGETARQRDLQIRAIRSNSQHKQDPGRKQQGESSTVEIASKDALTALRAPGSEDVRTWYMVPRFRGFISDEFLLECRSALGHNIKVFL
jgi:hypothetical protein